MGVASQIRSFVICHSSLALLTITPISNDSVHREADAGVGGDFVLRGQHHVLFDSTDARRALRPGTEAAGTHREGVTGEVQIGWADLEPIFRLRR